MTFSRLSTLTLMVLALGLAACSSGKSPTQVAQTFYEGLANQDFATARANATPQTADLIDSLVSRNGQDVFKVEANRKAHDEVINGDTAVVTFQNADGSIATVPLVKLDGAWKVDFSAIIEKASGGRARALNPVSE